MITKLRYPRQTQPLPLIPPPTFPLSIMSLPSPTHSSPTPPSPSPSSTPSSSPLHTLQWAFAPISDATTCTNLAINWTLSNTSSQLSTLYASPALSNGITLDITLSAVGSSNVTVPLRWNGSPADVLGSGGVIWFVDIQPGVYDILGFATANSAPSGVSTGGGSNLDVTPPIETVFPIHQGDNTSCLRSSSPSPSPSPSPSSPSSSSSLSSSSSHSNAGAIAGGIIGGIIALALLIGGLLILYRRRRLHAINKNSRNNMDNRRNLRRSSGDTKGWNGLNSVGSVVLEKNGYPSSPGSGGGGGKKDPFFAAQVVNEPGSPPGSPASVEMAHLAFRSPPQQQSPSPPPDPFATPIIPGTPRGGSDIGHDNDDSDRVVSSPESTHQHLTPPYTPYVQQQQQHDRRSSHHSTSARARKPVPTYDELDLTSEEKEALGAGSGEAPSYPQDDDGVSHRSLPSYKTSVIGSASRPENKDSNKSGGGDDDARAHAHAVALLQSLKSKSSGHMKNEAFVHYVIPDPPLEG